jgi:N-acetylglutamate synthase-like GNAT family acetyltransferase
MLKIRPAGKEDSEGVLKVLKDLDLIYPSLTLDNFWVAEKDGVIAGTVRLEDHKDHCFLSCFGVIEKERRQGTAQALLEQSFKNIRKNIYLYTIIPDYFKKFGFKEAVPPPTLPSQAKFGCEDCSPEKCVCMVKYPHAS